MANNLHISYDLNSPGQDYDKVIAKIKEVGSWAKLERSFWYVRSPLSAVEARDHILPAIDSGDTLYVVDATNGLAAWNGLSDEASEFVRNHWND